MRLRIFMVIGILLLVPSINAFADEGHTHSKDLSEEIETVKGEEQSDDSHDGHNMPLEEHKNMIETESPGHDDSSVEVGHGHGTKVYIETPPNYVVLSVFGAINLLFLVIGVWNKRIRKKVEINGNA